MSVGAIRADGSHSLDRRDPGDRELYLDGLHQAQAIICDSPDEYGDALALSILANARTLLTGFYIINGQQQPMLRR